MKILHLILLLAGLSVTACHAQNPVRDTATWQITVLGEGAPLYQFSATRVRDSVWIGLPTLQQAGFAPSRLRFKPGQPVLYAAGGQLHQGYTADPAHRKGDFLLPAFVIGGQVLWTIETMDCTWIQIIDSDVFDQRNP